MFAWFVWAAGVVLILSGSHWLCWMLGKLSVLSALEKRRG